MDVGSPPPYRTYRVQRPGVSHDPAGINPTGLDQVPCRRRGLVDREAPWVVRTSRKIMNNNKRSTKALENDGARDGLVYLTFVERRGLVGSAARKHDDLGIADCEACGQVEPGLDPGVRQSSCVQPTAEANHLDQTYSKPHSASIIAFNRVGGWRGGEGDAVCPREGRRHEDRVVPRAIQGGHRTRHGEAAIERESRANGGRTAL